MRAGVLVMTALVLVVPGRSRAAPVGAVPLATPAPAGTLKFTELRERGRRAYRAQRFDEAREFWSRAAVLKPEDAETAADLALALQHLTATDEAIQANRAAIRLTSPKRRGDDRAQRIRLGAYYNLGKLGATRTLLFDESNDGPSSCVRLASESGCSRPVFACGRTGATGGGTGGFDYTAARFALNREAARIVEDGQFVPEFESWVDFGDTEENSRDRSDAQVYDVTLALSSELREPMPGEADATVATENGGCVVVHVDACNRRLGLYCEWGSWREGVTAKPRRKAVELTFAGAQRRASP